MNKGLNYTILSFVKSNYKSLAWAGIILFLSIFHIKTPNSVKEIIIPHFDKIVHLGLYTILSFLLLFENKKSNPIYIRLLFAIFYGILMELFQHFFTNYRSMEIFDIVANTCGVFFGYFLFYLLQNKLKL
ncbi:MAG: hypothetical protein DRJ10_15445 [Bacteroidetes bacterium]|nr:MAG: hypothetical protein DRJ10_15445 [Bacteroidota bacterium]